MHAPVIDAQWSRRRSVKSQTPAQTTSMSAPSSIPQTLKHQGMPSAAVPRMPFIICSSDCIHVNMHRKPDVRGQGAPEMQRPLANNGAKVIVKNCDMACGEPPIIGV